MDMVLIIALVALGLIFVFVEIFFIPGSFIVGLLGGALAAGGVFLAYVNHGATYGNLFLLVSSVLFILMLVFGFKRITNWSQKESIEGRVNVLEEGLVRIGDEGLAFSDLRPNGKVVINSLRMEAYSVGDYIDRETPIEVTKVTKDRIYVKPKTS